MRHHLVIIRSFGTHTGRAHDVLLTASQRYSGKVLKTYHHRFNFSLLKVRSLFSGVKSVVTKFIISTSNELFRKKSTRPSKCAFGTKIIASQMSYFVKNAYAFASDLYLLMRSQFRSSHSICINLKSVCITRHSSKKK